MKKNDEKPPAPPPQPVDVVDGIPDRSSSRRSWKYLLLAAIFVFWMAFLIYCVYAGRI